MHSSEINKRQSRYQRNNRPNRRFQKDIFLLVNQAAHGKIKALAETWVPKSRISGADLVALNPTRADRNLGSFRINIHSGVWADFATKDRGRDIISFYAYIHGLTQIEAARALANLLGVEA